MKKNLATWAPLLFFLFPFCWFFGRAIFGQQDFVFRDTAHFYYPLFYQIQQQWYHWTIPLWSPFDGLGGPLLADGSSSVFYPGKILFFLPLKYSLVFRLYLLIHYLLAFIGISRITQFWNCSKPASFIAGLSFCFGGYLLSQHANVVFLVSTAWLPFAVLQIQKIVQQGSYASSIYLALIFAMMILGGDPQMVYHCLLILIGFWLLSLWQKQKSSGEDSQSAPLSLPKFLLLFLIVISLTVTLTAVQLFPTYMQSKHSLRSAMNQPSSIYDVLIRQKAEGEDHYAALLGKFDLSTHQRQVYDFSIGPWRFPELLWPNFSGKMYPVHQRWASTIPAEGRVWSPSLYAGLLPLLLIVSIFHLSSEQITVRWYSWLLLFSALAALGWHGLAWLYIEVGFSTGLWQVDELSFGQPFGSLYWLMTMILPKYDEFRYPAKWWAIYSLAASLLVALAWDKASATGFIRTKILLLGSLGLSTITLVLLYCFRSKFYQTLDHAAADALFGPLQTDGAFVDLTCGIWQTVILSLIMLGILHFGLKYFSKSAPWICVALLGLDLCLASYWIVQYNDNENKTVLTMDQLARLQQLEGPESIPRTFRRFRLSTYPQTFAETSSEQRQIEGQYWDQATLFPRYQLLLNQRNILSNQSIKDANISAVWQVATAKKKQRELVQLLGGEYQIDWVDEANRNNLTLVNKKYIEQGYQNFIGYYRDSQAFPTSWIVHHVQVLPNANLHTQSDYQEQAVAVLFEKNNWRDFRKEVVLETNELINLESFKQAGSQEKVNIINRKADQIELEAELNSKGAVVIQESYDPGWMAEVQVQGEDSEVNQWNEEPLFRANRIMQAVILPEGKHRIRLSYRPREFRLGATISLLGWVAICCWGLWSNVFSIKSKPLGEKEQASNS